MKHKHLEQVGKSRGHFSNTENRIQKIIDNWFTLLSKFEQMLERGKGLTETSRCAYATLLIMETGIRVGNESSAEGYSSINKYSQYYNKIVKTYGVTTLLKEHVTIKRNKINFDFLGKKQVEQSLKTTNKFLITYGKVRLQQPYLVTFLDIDYYTLKKFIKKYVGKNFSPKDIRQAFVNKLFIDIVSNDNYLHADVNTKAKVNKVIRSQVERTAEIVGHTPTVCKKSYITKSLMAFHRTYLTNIKEN